ncbi:hypothetical protein PENANT_c001G04647 [Penicillium antarcticum]|uniref:Uncharacterized protein n=1 Tax=Penicillium antarcticum TaxID=416450 RepID=A0A1V6QMH9_9EURO|nr:hypothetical protein PENANT_c001G04647 [Penicillium antarcticum]
MEYTIHHTLEGIATPGATGGESDLALPTALPFSFNWCYMLSLNLERAVDLLAPRDNAMRG